MASARPENNKPGEGGKSSERAPLIVTPIRKPTANRDHAGVAIQAPPNPGPGSSRAITGLPALARFAPRPLVLDLADQVSPHLREGMIKVALVGGCHEVRPSR